MSASLLEDVSDRPEWCPEGVWPSLKRTMVLSRCGVVRSSREQIAEQFGISVPRVLELLNKKEWKAQVAEMRERMEQTSGLAAEMATDELCRRLHDPAELAKLSPKELSLIGKQQGDMMLNLANGQAGGVQKPQFNFIDMRQFLGRSVEKPVIEV